MSTPLDMAKRNFDPGGPKANLIALGCGILISRAGKITVPRDWAVAEWVACGAFTYFGLPARENFFFFFLGMSLLCHDAELSESHTSWIETTCIYFAAHE